MMLKVSIIRFLIIAFDYFLNNVLFGVICQLPTQCKMTPIITCVILDMWIIWLYLILHFVSAQCKIVIVSLTVHYYNSAKFIIGTIWSLSTILLCYLQHNESIVGVCVYKRYILPSRSDGTNYNMDCTSC